MGAIARGGRGLVRAVGGAMQGEQTGGSEGGWWFRVAPRCVTVLFAFTGTVVLFSLFLFALVFCCCEETGLSIKNIKAHAPVRSAPAERVLRWLLRVLTNTRLPSYLSLFVVVVFLFYLL